VVQDDSFDATDSITICAVTTDETEAPLLRLPVVPNERNGLRTLCRLMVPRLRSSGNMSSGSGHRFGTEEAILVFHGLAASPRTRRET